ncbi:hypothetical protein Tco_0396365 [Tanacetum coccineum]
MLKEFHTMLWELVSAHTELCPVYTHGLEIHCFQIQEERISKKRTKNEAKTTKPDTEWKSVELIALCTNRVLALETDLKQTNKVYGTAYTKLIMKVKKLEKTIKTSQARRRAKIVVSDDDMDSKDSSKQGRMTEEIDQDAGVTLVTPTKVSSQEYQPEDQLGVLSAAKALAEAS